MQKAQDQHTEALRCAEKTQDHIQKLEIENASLKPRVKKQAGKIEQLQKNLLSTSSTDDLTAELEIFRMSAPECKKLSSLTGIIIYENTSSISRKPRAVMREE